MKEKEDDSGGWLKKQLRIVIDLSAFGIGLALIPFSLGISAGALAIYMFISEFIRNKTEGCDVQ